MLDLILKVTSDINERLTDSEERTRQKPYVISKRQLESKLVSYPKNLIPTIIAVLEEFEMIYLGCNENSPKQIFVLPHLLANEKPFLTDFWNKTASNDQRELNRIIQLNHIPAQIIPRIISRVLQYCNNSAKFLWASGILIEKIKNGEGVVVFIHHYYLQLSKDKHPVAAISIQVRGANIKLTQSIFAAVTSIVGLVISPFSLRSKSFWSVGNELKPLSHIEETLRSSLAENYESKQGVIPFSDIIPEQYIHTYDGPRVLFDDLVLGNKLGEGAFATVFKSSFKGQGIAVKKINSKPEALSDFQQEIKMQGNLDHPNIVKVVGICLMPYCVLQELCDGNLHDFAHNWEIPFPWKQRISITLDIARGLKYLHDKKPLPIGHLDLKSPNILLITHNDNIQAKISDFGTSQEIESKLTLRKVDNPVWCAPEILKGVPYDHLSDIYSFGVICWEILTREAFFSEISWQSLIEDSIVLGKRPIFPPDSPEDYRDYIIRTCWQDEPESRPQLSQVIARLCDMTHFASVYDEKHGNPQFQLQLEILANKQLIESANEEFENKSNTDLSSGYVSSSASPSISTNEPSPITPRKQSFTTKFKSQIIAMSSGSLQDRKDKHRSPRLSQSPPKRTNSSYNLHSTSTSTSSSSMLAYTATVTNNSSSLSSPVTPTTLSPSTYGNGEPFQIPPIKINQHHIDDDTTSSTSTTTGTTGTTTSTSQESNSISPRRNNNSSNSLFFPTSTKHQITSNRRVADIPPYHKPNKTQSVASTSTSSTALASITDSSSTIWRPSSAIHTTCSEMLTTSTNSSSRRAAGNERKQQQQQQQHQDSSIHATVSFGVLSNTKNRSGTVDGNKPVLSPNSVRKRVTDASPSQSSSSRRRSDYKNDKSNPIYQTASGGLIARSTSPEGSGGGGGKRDSTSSIDRSTSSLARSCSPDGKLNSSSGSMALARSMSPDGRKKDSSGNPLSYLSRSMSPEKKKEVNITTITTVTSGAVAITSTTSTTLASSTISISTPTTLPPTTSRSSSLASPRTEILKNTH